MRAGATDVLLGATATGKSATTAWLIEKLQRPTLVRAPNKTLAAQTASELRELFRHNAVEAFVSFSDSSRPESYPPSTDASLQTESVTNRAIDPLRHCAVRSLLTRRDVIVGASVSCIYGHRTPQSSLDRSAQLAAGQQVDRDERVAALIEIEYFRTDVGLAPGMFRSRRPARRAARDVRPRDRRDEPAPQPAAGQQPAAGIVPAPLVKRIGRLTADRAHGRHPITGTPYNRRMAAG